MLEIKRNIDENIVHARNSRKLTRRKKCYCTLTMTVLQITCGASIDKIQPLICKLVLKEVLIIN